MRGEVQDQGIMKRDRISTHFFLYHSLYVSKGTDIKKAHNNKMKNAWAIEFDYTNSPAMI